MTSRRRGCECYKREGTTGYYHAGLIVACGPQYLWAYRRPECTIDAELDLAPLPNDSGYGVFTYSQLDADGWSDWQDRVLGGHDEAIPLAFGAVVGGTLFGGLHCLVWDFHFPTPGEAIAWKICSLLTTGLPILSIAPFVAWQRVTSLYVGGEMSASRRMVKFLVGLTLLIVLFTYVLARLFLMVEIFRTLFFLPPEAFIETWSGSFPHFTG